MASTVYAYSNDIIRAFNKVRESSAIPFKILRTAGSPQLAPGSNADHRHQQGVQKLADGSLIVTGSANDNGGYFYLASPYSDGDYRLYEMVVPKATDFSLDLSFTNAGGKPFDHLGGCQVCGDYFAAGTERLAGESETQGTSVALLYRIGGGLIVPITYIVRNDNNKGDTAGAVGLAKIPNNGGWWMVVGNYNSARLDFYRCNLADLEDSNAVFAYYASAYPKNDKITTQTINGVTYKDVDTKWGDYQNLNLFIQSDGTLFLIGMHNNFSGEDYADLYVVGFGTYQTDSGYTYSKAFVTKVANKHFTCTSGVSMEYGSGFVLDPNSLEFEVFACEMNFQKTDSQEPYTRFDRFTS